MDESKKVVAGDNGEIRYLLNNNYNKADRSEIFIPYRNVTANVLQAAKDVLQTFDVIGFAEDYDLFVKRVYGLIGLPAPAEKKKVRMGGHSRKIE